MKKHASLETIIVLFACSLVALAEVITGILIGFNEAQNTRNNIASKAMSVAQTVANTNIVIQALDGNGNAAAVESFTTKVEKTTGVRFVVVMNMKHIRLSHPNPNMIGKPFVGGDEFRALRGEQYVSVARGTLGNSIRAFVPIRNGQGKEIGVVSVGIMMNTVLTSVIHIEKIVALCVGIGTVASILGALILAKRIKRTLFGFEPYEMATMWEERSALLEAVKEGVIAVNQNAKVVLVNASAKKLLKQSGLHSNLLGKNVNNFLEQSHVSQIVKNGKAEYDEVLDVNSHSFLVNQVPIRVNGIIVGAVVTFRDTTELRQLADQLTDVKSYADALRAQTHEFMNKLHVILGMLHIGEYARLTNYVQELTSGYHTQFGSTLKRIKEPALVGFFLGKLSYAKQHHVSINITGLSKYSLPPAASSKEIDNCITIIGNFIDNAVEISETQANKCVQVQLEYSPGQLKVAVSDSGPGIPKNLTESIFKKGVSTKGKNRGMGLFLVKQRVSELGGKLAYTSTGRCTTFTAVFPYYAKGDGEND